MRRSLPSVFIIGVILVLAVAGLRRLSFATDVLEILPNGIPEAEALKAYRHHFDDDNRVILLLEHEDEVFEEDAESLATFLREKLPEARVQYRPRLEEDRESYAKSLARLWADSSPAEVAAFVSRLEDPEKLADLLQEAKDKVALSIDQEEATRASYDPLGFLNHPAIAQLQGGGFDYQSEEGHYWLILIGNPDLGLEYAEHAAWVKRIRNVADGWLKDGYRYKLTGGPVFSSEIGRGMEKDMSGTIAITSLIVGALFLLTQRSLIQLGVLSVILVIVFLLTLGFAGWIYGTLNLVSVGFAAILLGLVIDYGVVIAREAKAGQSAKELRREMRPSIAWAAGTTAVVFGVLVFSTFQGVKQLGGLILIGLSVGAAVCLWLMPLALQRFPQKPASRCLKPPFPRAQFALSFLLLLFVGAGGVFVVNGPPEIEFDISMVEPEVSEAAQTLEVLQESFPAWSKRNLSVIVKGDSLAGIRASVTEAAAGIEALMAKGVITRADWPVAILPDRAARAENLVLWERVAADADRIMVAMEKAGFNEKGRGLAAQVIKDLAEVPETLDPFARMFYHEDGYFSGRIQLPEIVTKESASELESLNTDKVTVSGWELLRIILLERVEQDLYFLFIPATIVLLVALILVFRSWRDAVLTAGVLLVVLLLVNALVVLLGQPWNFLSSMAIPLIVGTGIDYSIHLVFALRRSGGDLAQVWNGVGKGIFFCGLSTVVGFGSLAFASNETLQSMGIFCGAGVLLTMTLSVIVVPPLWRALHRRSA